jgi:VCBS repeat-containing protein
MATQIGIVKAIIGEVTATAADGSSRTLQAGDRVFANELITTGPGGAIEIEFADGSLMDLGRNSQAMLDSEVFYPNDTAVAEGAQDDVPDDVAAIQQALLEGEDPTEIGEATAAGAGVEGSDGGHEAVFVDYLNPAVTPDAGFDTIGVTNSYDLPEEDIIILPEEDEQPTVPQVSVSVDVEIEIEDPQSPPPEDGVPTPEYPVLVEGNAASVLEGTSEGTKQVVFIINLSESFSQDVQVTYILQPVSSNGAADTPDDWFNGPSPQTVTIPAGSTSFPVYVEIVEDNIPEANGVFEIVLISANNATINPDADSATVTIYDDDVSLVSDDVSGDETDGLVELDGVIDADFGPSDTGSISVALSGGSWVGTATASANTVTADDGSWTLVINNDGTYKFTQNEAIDHPDSTDPDDPLTFEFTATATDSSGNTSSPSVFTVTVDDDGPVANNDADDAGEGEQNVTGNVLTNDTFGADEPLADGVVGVVAGVSGVAAVGSLATIETAYGFLTLNADGSYGYDAKPNAVPAEGATDVFTYTIQDADGDLSYATLTITLTDSGLTAAAGDIQADDAAVATADPADNLFTTTVVPSGGTGPFSFAIDAGHSDPSYGTFSVDPVTGVVTFNQTAAYDHASDSDLADDATSVNIVVTDANNNTYTTTVYVDITDDLPTINEIADIDMANELQVVTGQIDFDSGADGVNQFVINTINDGGFSSSVSGLGTSTITAYDANDQPLYTLTVDETGQYSFELLQTSTAGEVTFDLTGVKAGKSVESITFADAVDPTKEIIFENAEIDGSAALFNKSNGEFGVGSNLFNQNESWTTSFNNFLATNFTLAYEFNGSGTLTVNYIAYDSDGEFVSGSFDVSASGSTTIDFLASGEFDGLVDYIDFSITSDETDQSAKIKLTEFSADSITPPDDQSIDVGVTLVDGDGDVTDETSFNIDITANDSDENTEALDILGDEGSDIIVSSAGNDILTGGLGADTFSWNEGDSGEDIVTDFNQSAGSYDSNEGDALNISDLIGDIGDGNIADYISVADSADGAVIEISDTGDLAGNVTQTIVLEGVTVADLGPDLATILTNHTDVDPS